MLLVTGLASSSRNTMPKKGVAAGKGVWSRMNEPIEAPAFLDRSDPNYDSETEDFYLEEIYLGMGSLDDMLAHKQDVAKSPSPRGASHMPSPDPNDF